MLQRDAICELTDTSPYKRTRIMTATAMFHTKWLLSRDVQRLTVDNDTAAGCMSRRRRLRHLKMRWKPRLFRGNAERAIHARGTDNVTAEFKSVSRWRKIELIH